MNPIFFAVAGIIGWLAGVLGNLLADHLPEQGDGRAEGKSPTAISGLWHYLTLPWYLPRKGLCPCCKTRRSRRAPLLEAALMVAFIVTAWLAPDGGALWVAWFDVAFLAVVLVIDLEHRRVLNLMLIPAAMLLIAFSLLPGVLDPVTVLLGGAVGLALFGVLKWLSRGALGMGDVKLAGVIGLMVGYPSVVYALTGGALLAGLAALALLFSRKATLKSTMAYAPYLSISATLIIWNLLWNASR